MYAIYNSVARIDKISLFIIQNPLSKIRLQLVNKSRFVKGYCMEVKNWFVKNSQ